MNSAINDRSSCFIGFIPIPVMLALEMKQLMERENISRAELARRMGVSRARITQIMTILKLNPEVIEMIKEGRETISKGQ